MCRGRTAIERWIDVSARALRTISAAVLFMLAAIVSAVACPICFSGMVVTMGQQMDAADQVVLAVPLSDGQQFKVVAVVKGDFTVGTTVSEPVSHVKGALAIDAFVADPVSRSTAALPHRDKPFLLMRNALGQQWYGAGTIHIENAGWLRQLAATYRGDRTHSRPAWPRSTQTVSELTDDEWRERIALVAAYLENPEPLAADIAYGEISRAPYNVLRTLKEKLTATTVARWTDDPKLAARHPTYILLLGIAGGPNEAPSLERRIDAAWAAHDATNLAAMLAADLELRGPSRVDSIESYFSDGNRTLPEIEAALLALSVQGGANGAIPRARVIAAYRSFMRERKAMAGFVANELADWEYWDATEDYVALLKSNAVKDPAAHFMIVNYLQRSPSPAAKAALRLLARERY